MDRMTNHYKNLNNSNWLINVQDIMLDGYILIVFFLPLWNCHRHQFLKRPLKIILQVALGRWQCILPNTILTILSDSVGIWYHNFKFATWLYDLGFFGVICFQTKSTWAHKCKKVTETSTFLHVSNALSNLTFYYVSCFCFVRSQFLKSVLRLKNCF